MSHPELDSLANLRAFYREHLVENLARFWLDHALDREHGGYLTILDRDGSAHGTGKYIWPQARTAYMFAKLYNELEPRPQWLDAARLGIDFLDDHGLRDGRAFYKCTRDGRPIYARPNEIYGECFAVIAYAHFAKAASDQAYLHKARELFDAAARRLESGELDSHLATQLYQEHAAAMILINCAQELRAVDPDERYTRHIRPWVERELFTFASPQHRAMFERVGVDGRPILTEPEGRSLTPGHAMESAWFCLEEGMRQKDHRLIDRAVDVVRWTIERGWDTQHGGVFNFLDILGKPPGHHDEDWGEGQDWDAKLYWPHAETLYALLLAHLVTRDPELWDWYAQVHRWAFDHFPDREFGEWYGFLRRDGSVSQTLKGSIKSFFHVPRAILKCVQAI
ncbi:MAG: AGE family epimerase/isomerase, partial [Phycisphaeraceae bacterium]|nr:AGE family epimerase/isomerase [Phycisphaeraceae bacterium]